MSTAPEASTPAQGQGHPVGRARFHFRPTHPFVIYCAMLGGFWYAAISQNNAVAYMLLFFLLSAGLISVPLGYRNLRHVAGRIVSDSAGYADEPLAVRILTENRGATPAWGLTVSAHSAALPAKTFANTEAESILPRAQGAVEVTGHAPRGVYTVDDVVFSSVFPLGLFRWEKHLPANGRLVVYPERQGDLPLPPPDSSEGDTGASARAAAGEDFRGWRKCQPGDSSRHIDWKAVARGHPLMIKEMGATTGDSLVLSNTATGQPEMEGYLAQIARWVWLCNLRGISYGVRLPGLAIAQGSGDSHARQVLEALAEYRGGEARSP